MKRTDETMSTYFTASFSAYDVKCCLSQKFQSQDKKRKKKRNRKTSIASHSVFCFYFASYFIFNQDLLIVTRLVLTI